jgi:hypothetical protein
MRDLAFVGAFVMAILPACTPYNGRCAEGLLAMQATSTTCPPRMSLARVCAPEDGGPCGLRCVMPLAHVDDGPASAPRNEDAPQ